MYLLKICRQLLQLFSSKKMEIIFSCTLTQNKCRHQASALKMVGELLQLVPQSAHASTFIICEGLLVTMTIPTARAQKHFVQRLRQKWFQKKSPPWLDTALIAQVSCYNYNIMLCPWIATSPALSSQVSLTHRVMKTPEVSYPVLQHQCSQAQTTCRCHADAIIYIVMTALTCSGQKQRKAGDCMRLWHTEYYNYSGRYITLLCTIRKLIHAHV